MGRFPLIFLEPTGGICNRLRALVSAQVLARDCRSSLAVLWYCDSHLGARFDEIFLRPPDLGFVATIQNETIYRITDRAIPTLFKRRLEQGDVERMNKEQGDYVNFAQGRRVFIRTHSRFHCVSDLTLVKPRPEIVAAVDRYALEKSGAVGVHIRRTDHQRAIEYSPTELFIAAMREELAVDPQTRFFLATDSPEDEALLQQTFPGRILIHPKRSWRRSDPQAIRDAMIDLYALARCRKLIGSYWSSFTDTAAALGGMPVRIIKRA